MSWFNNMTLKGKLLAGFITVAIIAGVIGGFGIYKSKRLMMPTPCSMKK